MNLKLVNNLSEANGITHAGSFHADDVFASVFLANYYDELCLYRTNEIIENSNAIMYDRGGGEFDHHFLDAKVRENGILYSSFGLLWNRFGKDFLEKKGYVNKEELFLMIDKEFVLGIDAIDNGVFPTPNSYRVNSVSDLIAHFKPTWLEDKNLENQYFYDACIFANTVFQNMIRQFSDKLMAKSKVESALKDCSGFILMLGESMPFMEFILQSKLEIASQILYVIAPNSRGQYSIHAVQKNMETFENRLPLCSEWGGKTTEELQLMTGIETFQFCHKNLFLATAKTLEDAIKIAQLAIKKGS